MANSLYQDYYFRASLTVKYNAPIESEDMTTIESDIRFNIGNRLFCMEFSEQEYGQSSSDPDDVGWYEMKNCTLIYEIVKDDATDNGRIKWPDLRAEDLNAISEVDDLYFDEPEDDFYPTEILACEIYAVRYSDDSLISYDVPKELLPAAII